MIDASASSQFVSALLLAGARYDKGVDVLHDGKPVPSMPHIEMTVSLLRRHGVEVDDAEPNRWQVAPGPVTALDTVIEPDLSNAAPFLALAAVTGGSVTVLGWPRETTQPGDALRDLLARMGCEVDLTDEGLTVTGPPYLAGHRRRPPRRRRADAGGRRALRAGRVAVGAARHRPHPRPRDRPARRAGPRARRPRRRRRRDRGRAHLPARGPARRAVPHLRRPPDGPRRRRGRRRPSTTSSSRTSRPPPRPTPASPTPGRGCCDQSS